MLSAHVAKGKRRREEDNPQYKSTPLASSKALK